MSCIRIHSMIIVLPQTHAIWLLIVSIALLWWFLGCVTKGLERKSFIWHIILFFLSIVMFYKTERKVDLFAIEDIKTRDVYLVYV